ncbi:MAG: ASPIC/UnbV domain-containing protein [Phycisphaerales bacterium]|nr:ASPIC/UnbV domain-containing protein [Phycisphaerales bacterium]
MSSERTVGEQIRRTGTEVELYASDGTTYLGRREIGVARGFGGTELLRAHFGGGDPMSTYTVRVYFQSSVQTVQVKPEDAATTLGMTTIPQMHTVRSLKSEGRACESWSGRK